jgi:glutamate dehydrogenase (NAD(P)+)
VTGKPLELQGSEGREAATGRGVVAITELFMRDLGRPMENATVAIQGFGNVGSHAALLAHERGAKVIALSDASVGIACPNGLDVPRLFEEYARPRRPLVEYDGDGVERLSQDELLTREVDILIPSALGGVLTREIAPHVGARVIVEAANAPVLPEADEILARRGIPVIPDILANAGGVTVSYFEWAQNIQCFRWTEDEVNQRLDQVMAESYRTIEGLVQSRNLSWRRAAYTVALGRVAKAIVVRGV